jgi:hypothetical protein
MTARIYCHQKILFGRKEGGNLLLQAEIRIGDQDICIREKHQLPIGKSLQDIEDKADLGPGNRPSTVPELFAPLEIGVAVLVCIVPL